MTATDRRRRHALDAPLADARLWREFAYVAGRWTAGEATRPLPVTDPADGETIGRVAALTAAQAAAATDAAEAAFPAWSDAAAAGAQRHPPPLVRA